MNRRNFLLSSTALVAGSAASAPLKIAHRQANLMQGASLEVFELAHRITGLSGIELQVVMKGYSLWDRDTMAIYKRQADRFGLQIPSLAGVWPPGRSLVEVGPAEECLDKAIQAADGMKARTVLVAAFGDRCPKMDDRSSYEPVVQLLRKAATWARAAGVIIGLELSLNIEDHRKLIGLVNSPNVRVYWDAFNVEHSGFAGEGIRGIDVLGTPSICQVHCKNEGRLLEEPGKVDWSAAFHALKRVGYHGWYVLETRHSSPEQAVEASNRNIEFMRRELA